MATDPLTEEENEANNFLTKNGCYTFTKEAYQKDLIARLFLERFLMPDAVAYFTQWIDIDDKYSSVYNIVNDKKNHSLNLKLKLSIEKLFGIKNEALISIISGKKDILHDYEEASCTNNIICENCHEGYIQKETYTAEKIHDWVNYCNLVNQFIIQIKKDEKEWRGSQKKKTTYKNKWIELSKVSFIKNEDSPSNIDLYIDYLNANNSNEGYGLNRGTKAKAKFLLSKNLPNITEYDIAKRIVEYSSLLKNT